MLFNTLFALNIILISLYLYFLTTQKIKHYTLSILIRLLILGLFGFVIFDTYETKNHLIIVLSVWIVFELIENFYKNKIISKP